MLNPTPLHHSVKLRLAMAMLVSLGSSLPAHADERESLEQLKATTTNLIELLVQEGVLAKDKADNMLKKATQDAERQVKQAKAADAANKTEAQTQLAQDEQSVHVQYVPEHIKKEMREELKKEMLTELNYKAGERLAMPSWLDRISYYGDLRLRGERNIFSDSNFEAGQYAIAPRFIDINNTTEDRDRLRIRARLGADIKVNDLLTGGLRLTTGRLTSPVSPHQTEQFSEGKYTFGLDRAFLKANVKPWLSFEGGRIANPFFSTDILWDPDLAFDGLALHLTPKINNSWSSFSTIGAFPIESIETSSTNKAKDKWLYSAQAGIKWESQNKSSVRLAAAYHDYRNVEGRSNSTGLADYDGTVPSFRQKGNNTFSIDDMNGGASKLTNPFALASKFEQVNLIGQVDILKFDPIHVTLTGDYVKNIGFDAQEIRKRTGNDFEEENEAYQVRLDVGHASFNGGPAVEVKPHDWQFFVAYKRLEADSVLDGFTDSNFHMGGTDAKGWLVGANYAIDKNAWLSARFSNADSITGIPLSIDVLLIDFNAKF